MSNYFTDKNIDFWIQKNQNVLLRGKHGVGKTARILEAFTRHGLKYQYFSASTMDPWVDFIGVPREKTENGVTFLDLVRPKVWQDDSVEAIFLDEFNRSSKKVRNAVMELIQFKSINGKKFNNLRMVWAAINPEEEEINKYDVEALDPAQMDRFHVILNVPYKPDADYFRTKYGRELADIAITWWNDQLDEKQRDQVSPRRLDYMLQTWKDGGELKPMVPVNINLQPLTSQLQNGPLTKQLDEIFAKRDLLAARKFMGVENNYTNTINRVIKDAPKLEFFLPALSPERVVGLMTQHNQVKTLVFENYEAFKDIVHNLAAAGSGQLSQQAKNVIQKHVSVESLFGEKVFAPKPNASVNALKAELSKIKIDQLSSTAARSNAFEAIRDNMPGSMDTQTAAEALKILEVLLARSQKPVIESRMPELVSLVKHVCNVFTAAGHDWKAVVDYRAILDKLMTLETISQNEKKATGI